MLGAENTVVITSDPPIPEVGFFSCLCGKYLGERYQGIICDKCGKKVILEDNPVHQFKRSHAYNRKCQDYSIFWQVGPFNFSMECNRSTKKGHLFCEKHQQEVKGIDTRIAEVEARILYCAKHQKKEVK